MKDYADFNQPAFNRWVADRGDETHRLNYNLKEDSIIFDLGGYVGEWSNTMFERYNSSIYIFEPVKKFYNGIRERFESNPKIFTFNYGLGPKNEELSISLTKDSSSVFNPNGDRETIEIKSVCEFLKKYEIKKIDLLKINIEGGEYSLIENLIENDIVKMIDNIQVQFHGFIPDCVERRELIQKKLSESHELTYDYEFIWENWKIK
jgi:FkbM family methyltransferase